MPQTKNYLVKIADKEAEFDLIHKLNYRTFVEEIPQHERNDHGSLIDRFHLENTYLIALDGDHLAGMMAVRGNRPFSLDYKISDLDRYLPIGRKVCEIRLLAIEEEYRNIWGFNPFIPLWERKERIISQCVRRWRILRETYGEHYKKKGRTIIQMKLSTLFLRCTTIEYVLLSLRPRTNHFDHTILVRLN